MQVVNIMVILTPHMEPSTAQLQSKLHQLRFNKWDWIWSHHNTSHRVHLESVIFCLTSPKVGSSWGKQYSRNSILLLWTSNETWILQGLCTDSRSYVSRFSSAQNNSYSSKQRKPDSPWPTDAIPATQLPQPFTILASCLQLCSWQGQDHCHDTVCIHILTLVTAPVQRRFKGRERYQVYDQVHNLDKAGKTYDRSFPPTTES